MMVPDEPSIDLVDVVAALNAPTIGHDVIDDVFSENLHESEGPCLESIPKGTPFPPTAARSRSSRSGARTFPIDWSQDEYISRRDLTKFMALTSMAFVAGAVLDPRAERPAAAARRLSTAGDRDGRGGAGGNVDGVRLPRRDDQRVLVRLGEEQFVAYDQKCTHLLCPVFPRVEEGVLHCPCHNGYFDIGDGRPIAGPPRGPCRASSSRSRAA
jgi:nitrite reductase/ring-hydroxylating ferredoxin subunit